MKLYDRTRVRYFVQGRVERRVQVRVDQPAWLYIGDNALSCVGNYVCVYVTNRTQQRVWGRIWSSVHRMINYEFTKS
jgi:hypothetical protein